MGTAMMDDVIARSVVVSGRVQGVWYRQSCADEAVGLGVFGWVKNLPDGRVEGWFEGPRAAVEALIAWCRRGPQLAKVDDVAVVDIEVAGFDRFEVRR